MTSAPLFSCEINALTSGTVDFPPSAAGKSDGLGAGGGGGGAGELALEAAAVPDDIDCSSIL